MNVQKFKAYWEKIGRPPVQVFNYRSGLWVDVNKHNPDFEYSEYRIKDDPNWELRSRWIDSDFTLPIELKSNEENDWSVSSGCEYYSIGWLKDFEYREAKQPISINEQAKCVETDPGAHYRYEYKGIKLDPARIADVYNITNHMQFFILKKGLKAGERGHKDLKQDLADIKGACDRWLEMMEEDCREIEG